MNGPTAPKPFTPETLADRWECSPKHVRNLVNRGDLPGFRLGGKLLRIKAEDVEAYECPQNIASGGSEGSSASSTGKTENGNVAHLEPLTRARLIGLRQRFMPNSRE